MINWHEGKEGMVSVWDAALGREEFTLKPGTGVRYIAFSPDSKRIAIVTATGSWDDRNVTVEVRIYDLASRSQLLVLPESPGVTSIAFSPEGRWIATGSLAEVEVGDVKIWDASTGRLIHTLRADDGVRHLDRYSPGVGVAKELGTPSGGFYGANHIAFSGDGRHLACAKLGSNHEDRDTESGREVATLRGQTGVGGSVAFSPDGKRIATSDSNGAVWVWDAHDPQASPLPGFGYVDRVAFGGDSSRSFVAAGSVILPPKDLKSELKGRTSSGGAWSENAARDRLARVVEWTENAPRDRLTRVFDTTCGEVTLRPDSRSWANGRT